MSVVLFSAIADGRVIAFDPDSDLLSFDDPAVSAADLRFEVLPDGAGLLVTASGKSFTLAGVPLADLDAGNTRFQDGSLLVNASHGDPAVSTWQGSVHDDLLISTPALAMTLASTNADGSRASNAHGPALSADGRQLVFTSDSSRVTDLPDAGSDNDVFIKDLFTGETLRASGPGNGQAEPVGSSSMAALSGDGRYVAFYSTAANLVSGDTNGVGDLFLKDLQTGSLLRVSTTASGGQANGASFSTASVSADGRYVAFVSEASNLVAGDTNGARDVFVKDTLTGAIVRASTTASGGQSNAGLYGGGNIDPQLSADGQFVVFRSFASNLVAGDNNGLTDLFVKNLQTGALQVVSTSASGAFTEASISGAAISADGRYVAFASSGALLADGQNGQGAIYLRDLQTGTLSRVTGAMDSTPEYRTPGLSGDGRFVVFETADPLLGADNDGQSDVYVKDMLTGQLALVSTVSGGSPVDFVTPTISQDGHTIAFAGDGGVRVVANPLDVRRLAGGAGGDRYLVSQSGDEVVELAGQGSDTVESSASYVLSDNVEQLVLTGSANLRGTGNALDNRLQGNAGANTLDGGAGRDTLVGGAGDDSYLVDHTGDVLVEAAGEGYDRVDSSVSYTLAAGVEQLNLTGSAHLNATGNAADNLIAGNAGNNVLDGGAGVDTLNYSAANAAVSVSLASTSAQATGGAGTDTVLGFENLTGTRFADALTGNTGANRLDGGQGADTLTGGAGDDTYVVDHGDDRLVETAGGGNDSVLSSISWTLSAELENLTLTGSNPSSGVGNAAANRLTGNSGYNQLSGGNGADTLDGGAGGDSLDGGSGDDVYLVDHANDRTIEAAGSGQDLVRASLSWTLADNLEHLELQGSAVQGSGNALANRITGTDGNNTLVGNAGADTLTGGLGNDTYGADASDVLVELTGGGIDLISASSSWTLAAEFENLRLSYGTAALNGTGNAVANQITGNDGANVLDGGLGADTLIGGGGDDTYFVDQAGDQLSELAFGGNDTVRSTLSWQLGSELEQLVLLGTASINATGNERGNLLYGNAGNNLLDGGAGVDTMTGGAGNDTYVVDALGDRAVEAAGGGVDMVQASLGWTLGSELENLQLTGNGAINGWGNALNNRLTGNAAANALDGGLGADSLIGGAGNDRYIVDNIGDVVSEQAGGGVDHVSASLSWVLSAEVEDLSLSGTAAINASGNALNNHLTGNSAANVLNGGLGADTLTGGGGNDTYVVDQLQDRTIEQWGGGSDLVQASLSWVLGDELESLLLTGGSAINGTGNALANRITGNAAANTLDGGDGVDTLVGGAGNDSYLVDTDTDQIIELAGGGTDTVFSSSAWNTLGAELEHLVLTGQAFSGTGNSLANQITGNGQDNILTGGLGADTLTGGAGDDWYSVDQSGDRTVEAAGGGIDRVEASISWTLAAEVEHLTLSGTAALTGTGNGLANELTGNSGANRLSGGDGADTLDGGAGSDSLYGGAGDDVYRVDSSGDVASDLVGGGLDRVEASVSWTLGAELEDLVLLDTPTGVLLNGTGNSLNNHLSGNYQANVLNGGLGADTLAGGEGDDTYVVDQLGDQIIEDQWWGGEDLVQASLSWTLQNGVERLTLTGSAAINGSGNAAANTLTGNGAANVLTGGAGLDRLFGGTGSDSFVLTDALSWDVISDFASGLDKLLISQATLRVGDGDALVEGATSVSGPGGFASSAEWVLVTRDIVGTITTASAAAAIGSAKTAYAVGATALFMVDNGVSSELYLFRAADANATVSASELSLLAELSYTPGAALGDLIFGP